MPRKVRELKSDLQRAGFRVRPGKGSHTVWEHPLIPEYPVTVSGHDGGDAERYQEKDVREALRALREAQARGGQT